MGRIETGRSNTSNREGKLPGFLNWQEVEEFPFKLSLGIANSGRGPRRRV